MCFKQIIIALVLIYQVNPARLLCNSALFVADRILTNMNTYIIMIIAALALVSNAMASDYFGKSSKASSKSGKGSIKCNPYSGKAEKSAYTKASKMVSVLVSVFHPKLYSI